MLTGQNMLTGLIFDPISPFNITAVESTAGMLRFARSQPLFSILADSIKVNSVTRSGNSGDTLWFDLADTIHGWAVIDRNFQPGLKILIRFRNGGRGLRRLENIVPTGEGDEKVYITAAGSKEWPGYLCRSRLYRPGCGPVGVLLPDNAWHLGFADFRINDTISLVALARRGQCDKERSDVDRWKVTLRPCGWVEYNIYLDCHAGDWHNGLRMMFRDRWLYDLPAFNNSLFERRDLAWIRNSCIMLLQFAWDKKYYDCRKQEYTFYDNLHEYDSLTGGFDIYTLWPTWPRLGLDQRNQWDMYRDLPGGLAELRSQVDFTHRAGKRYFISYNPWDEGSRKEDQLKGMEDLLRATNADGVVLDTRGASSRELQESADRVKPGIIMYSEGMAVPKDMPGIVSGRVHDALVLPPPLNLNKYIKPEFAIFRVLQLADDRIHRELAISFFNGYGVEINTMRPGRPAWIAEEFAWMGRTTRILRENNSVFHNDSFYPLVPTLADSVYVNRWESNGKTIFTIYSANPSGHHGPLFETAIPGSSSHVVDLWNHLQVVASTRDMEMVIPVSVDPFPRSWLNSRREGNAGCIAVFPALLWVKEGMDSLIFSAKAGKTVVLTPGDPGYSARQFRFNTGRNAVAWNYFSNNIPGKVVIQLFDTTELLDERVVFPVKGNIVKDSPVKTPRTPDRDGGTNGKPKLVSIPLATPRTKHAPAGMAEIPAGNFRFYTLRDRGTLEPFIPFPDFRDTLTVTMPRYFMDVTPVTNAQFQQFIAQSSYIPKDTSNYLKHWLNGKPVKGTENMPVVFVSPGDAAAYAKWAGKRLPAEMEWQYAAQGNDGRKYPWGNHADSTRCNSNLNFETPVGQFPGGASPFGVTDMVGNVWQMTADEYDNGCYYYRIIRGGSYYHPTQSIWYVTGGPLPVDHPEMLLLLAPGLDRNATVGFRCVKYNRQNELYINSKRNV